MSSRVNTKKTSSLLNKENDGALNVAKKACVPQRKDAFEKKPVLKQSKSNVLCQPDSQTSESENHKAAKTKEDNSKDLMKDERKKESIKFCRSETEKLMNTYGKTWITDMKSKEKKSWPKNFLSAHKISASVRAKMVVFFLPRSTG
jgi:hypothetical protein